MTDCVKLSIKSGNFSLDTIAGWINIGDQPGTREQK
jgi:hypothetical protein